MSETQCMSVCGYFISSACIDNTMYRKSYQESLQLISYIAKHALPRIVFIDPHENKHNQVKYCNDSSIWFVFNALSSIRQATH